MTTLPHPTPNSRIASSLTHPVVVPLPADPSGNSVYYDPGNTTLTGDNFPTGGGTGVAQFQSLNDIGFGLTTDGDPWINGQTLDIDDLVPPDYAGEVSVVQIAYNSTLAAGTFYPGGNTSAPPHAALLVPCSLAVDANNDGNFVVDPTADDDNDGLTNEEEYEYGTDPENPDTDGDGVPDGADAIATDPEISYPRAPIPQYAIIDLGPGQVMAVSNQGAVLIGAVNSTTGALTGNYEVWQNGQFINPPDGYYIYSAQFDSLGELVGTCYDMDDVVETDDGGEYYYPEYLAFRWTLPTDDDPDGDFETASLTDLFGTLPSTHIDINNAVVPQLRSALSNGDLWFELHMPSNTTWHVDDGVSWIGSIDRLVVWSENGTVTAAKDLGLSVTEPDFLSYNDWDYDSGTEDYTGTSPPGNMTRYYPVADNGNGTVIWRQETATFELTNNTTYGGEVWQNAITQVAYYLGNTTGPTYTTPLAGTLWNGEDFDANGEYEGYYSSNGTYIPGWQTNPPDLGNVTFATAPVNLFTLSQAPGQVWLLDDAGNAIQKTLYDDVPDEIESNFTVGPNVAGYGISNGELWANNRAFDIGDLMSEADYDTYGGVEPLAISSNNGLIGGQIASGDGSMEEASIAVPYSLSVDNNRDGNISLVNSGDEVTPDNPFRFWVNDDDDSGNTTGSDIPGNGTNGYNSTIPGTKDLVNYFPVYINVGQLLKIYPDSDYNYVLYQADNAVAVVYSNLTVTHAFDYLRPPASSGPLQSGFGDDFNQAPSNATTHLVTDSGFTLSNNFLDPIASGNQGILLVDGVEATNQPLVLSIQKPDGTPVIGNLSLSLNITGIEQMYRQINLRSGTNAPSGLVGSGASPDTGLATNTTEPGNFKDVDNDTGWIFFLAGYHVGGDAARGWAAEVFKELYWSHSHAKFVAVTWFGNPTDSLWGSLPDYHATVRNAFATAPALASFIGNSTLFPGSKTVIAHSLGCMVVSSALQDDGLSVNHVCLVDAAIAREAFDGSSANDPSNMTLPSWSSYPTQLWASNWHALFNGTTDARGNLTWQNRFAGAASSVTSFYSSTEDVLAVYSGDPSGAIVSDIVSWLEGTFTGQYAWVVQEKTKGNYIPAGSSGMGSQYMGWGFNLMDPVDAGNISDPIWYGIEVTGTYPAYSYTRGPVSASVAEGMTMTYMSGNFERSPLFMTGWGSWNSSSPSERVVDTSTHSGPAWIANLYDDSLGSAAASGNRTELLAEAIPALSLPVGANLVTNIPHLGSTNQEFNMPAAFVPNTSYWPRSPIGGVAPWFHTDMQAMAYPYLYKFYDQLVTISKQ